MIERIVDFSVKRRWLVLLVTLVAAVSGLWSLTSSRVGGRSGAVAVGLINSTGNLGGFAGNYAIGSLKTSTGGYTAGLAFLALGAIMAGALCLCVDLEKLGEVG